MDEMVVLQGGGVEMEASLRAALAPLGMTVSIRAEPLVTGSGPAGRDGELRPNTEGAAGWATVTIAPAPTGGATLSVVEQGSGRVMDRRLREAPPFAPADAASIALMARTMLVALRTPPSAAPPAPMPATESRPARPGDSRFLIEAGAGARFSQAAAPAAALTAALSFYRAHLGAALSLLVSPERAISGAGFEGRLRDDAVALTLRLPLPAGHLLIEPNAGLALHWARLSGALLSEPTGRASQRDLDPALRIGGRLSMGVTHHLVLVAWADADCLLRRQRYFIGQEQVAAVGRIQAVTGLTLGLLLP